MEAKEMTWRDIFIVGIAMILSWGIGIAMLQFPGGISAKGLRKTAQLALRLAERSDWFRLTWTHTRVWTPKGKITYYEMLQYEAQDPEKAIRTYFPWAIPVARFFALVWLGVTIWGTIVFLRDLFGG